MSSLLTNLVSYWKLDHSSGNATDSVGSNTLTNNNTATYATGKIGNGVDLEDGSSQSLSVADGSQSGLDPAGSFSISAWFKLESLPGASKYYQIICKRDLGQAADDSTSQYALWYDNDGSRRLQFALRASGANEGVIHTATLNTAQWYHVVAVFTASTKIELFLDNTSVASDSTSVPASIVNTSLAFCIGKDSAGTAGQFFDGMIDEVGFWSKALSTTEIAALYNGGNGLSYPFSNGALFTGANF